MTFHQLRTLLAEYCPNLSAASLRYWIAVRLIPKERGGLSFPPDAFCDAAARQTLIETGELQVRVVDIIMRAVRSGRLNDPDNPFDLPARFAPYAALAGDAWQEAREWLTEKGIAE